MNYLILLLIQKENLRWILILTAILSKTFREKQVHKQPHTAPPYIYIYIYIYVCVCVCVCVTRVDVNIDR